MQNKDIHKPLSNIGIVYLCIKYKTKILSI